MWCDFATGQDKGDLLDLWCATRNIKLTTAFKEAQEWLGIVRLPVTGFRLAVGCRLTDAELETVTRPRLIVTDLDGTFLGPDRLVSATNLAAARRAALHHQRRREDGLGTASKRAPVS